MAQIIRAPRSSTWLWVLVAAAVLTQSGLNLFRPITSYKLLGLGADPVVVGLTTAAYALLPLVTALWLGRMSDRIPQLRLLILAGVGFLALAGVGLALANSVWFVFAASAVLGMGHLCFTIGGQTAIARYAADRDLDKGFGWFTAAFSAGQMIGPALGGWIVGHGSDVTSPERLAAVNESLWIGVLVTVLAAPLLAFRLGPASRRPGAGAPSDDDAAAAPAPHGTSAPDTSATTSGTAGDDAPSAAKHEPRADERPDVLRILRTPGVMSNMVASLSLLAMIDILTAFLPLVGEEAGVAPSVVGVLLGARGLASIASRLLLPLLSGRFSRRALLIASLLASGLALIVPPLLLDSFWWAALFLAVGGFFLGLGQPLTMTLISTAVPGTWRGSALAVRLMGNRLGQVVLPVAAGAVAAPFGPGGAIWLTCALLVASGVEKAVRRPREG
ncbi:MFS transporter [Kocuria rhizophila]|uniref:MFS transporter n=1 Tax=Kocuria rhizophila TaxID=72000 RepID=A0AAX2SEE6_KOCRH|nr:MFS transporter [Kocuria rhizophila]TFI01678.1 MFS transporter [Kocuria rhizophila]TFI11667.1 MFS transporter [Kocuria rhizophila]WIW67445.1 MFS transporter [Kocuria sp. ChxB]